MTAVALLSIGRLAEATGASISALRYYDRIGLVQPVTRESGQRRFEPSTVGRVNFVRRAQDVGFSLEEIAALLDDDAGDWRPLVDDKIGELTDRRRHLDQMIDLLTEMRRCGCESVATCTRASC